MKENMSTQMDKLKAAQEKTLQKLHKAQEEEKQIRKRMAELTRNERTHRLCTRGGYLEKLLIEPELFTDEDVFAFLDYALSTPFVQTRLNSMLESRRKAAAGQPARSTTISCSSSLDFLSFCINCMAHSIDDNIVFI